MESLDEMEARHIAERKTLAFVQADADKGKSDADKTIAAATKASADISTAVETTDSMYVTINVPTAKTGADQVMWDLLVAQINADPTILTSASAVAGTIRVHKDHVAAVVAKIEATLP